MCPPLYQLSEGILVHQMVTEGLTQLSIEIDVYELAGEDQA